MNKGDLVNYISDDVGITKKDAAIVVESMLKCIKSALENKSKVNLSGLGSFHFKKRNARIARNPRTGESVEVPEKTVVKFRPSGKLQEKINK